MEAQQSYDTPATATNNTYNHTATHRSNCSRCGKDTHDVITCQEAAYIFHRAPFFDVDDASVDKLEIPRQEFLDAHKDVHKIITACLIFKNDTILLLKRQQFGGPSTQIGSWELPGGFCNDYDSSILHNTARQVVETTNLGVKTFNSVVGTYKFGAHVERNGITQPWMLIAFDVDVIQASDGYGGPREVEDRDIALTDVHRYFWWATELEVRDERVNGLEFPVLEKNAVLNGFEARRVRAITEGLQDVDIAESEEGLGDAPMDIDSE